MESVYVLKFLIYLFWAWVSFLRNPGWYIQVWFCHCNCSSEWQARSLSRVQNMYPREGLEVAWHGSQASPRWVSLWVQQYGWDGWSCVHRPPALGATDCSSRQGPAHLKACYRKKWKRVWGRWKQRLPRECQLELGHQVLWGAFCGSLDHALCPCP